MPIGLIKAITTQKVLKTCINKGVKYHFLGSNHLRIDNNNMLSIFMLSGSIQFHSSILVYVKSCNFTIQNFQIFLDDQCQYNTYTYFIYHLLWFIDHPEYTLSYVINHL